MVVRRASETTASQTDDFEQTGLASFASYHGATSRWWRQEIYLAGGRDRDHFGRIREVINLGEQFIQLARWSNPEQGVYRFIANVLVAVRNAHGQPCQSTSGKTMRTPVERQFHLAFDEVDEFVLRGVDMRRHESAGFADHLEGERRIAEFLEIIGLS